MVCRRETVVRSAGWLPLSGTDRQTDNMSANTVIESDGRAHSGRAAWEGLLEMALRLRADRRDQPCKLWTDMWVGTGSGIPARRHCVSQGCEVGMRLLSSEN